MPPVVALQVVKGSRQPWVLKPKLLEMLGKTEKKVCLG